MKSLMDCANMTLWLFTVPNVPENERAVEEHRPEVLLSVITALQTAITQESSSKTQLKAASVMSEVIHQ
jgi:hypothetical protein